MDIGAAAHSASRDQSSLKVPGMTWRETVGVPEEGEGQEAEEEADPMPQLQQRDMMNCSPHHHHTQHCTTKIHSDRKLAGHRGSNRKNCTNLEGMIPLRRDNSFLAAAELLVLGISMEEVVEVVVTYCRMQTATGEADRHRRCHQNLFYVRLEKHRAQRLAMAALVRGWKVE